MYHRDRAIIGAGWFTIMLAVCGLLLGVFGVAGVLLDAVASTVRELSAMPAEPDDEPMWSMVVWYASAALLSIATWVAGWRIIRGFARNEHRRLRTGLWLALGSSVGWFVLGQFAPGLWLSPRDAALIPTAAAFLQGSALFLYARSPRTGSD